MAEVQTLLNEISTPVKVGWLLWVAWGIVQIAWLQRIRMPARASERALEPRPVWRGSSRRRPIARAQGARDDSGQLLNALGLLDPQPTPSPYGVPSIQNDDLDRR